MPTKFRFVYMILISVSEIYGKCVLVSRRILRQILMINKFRISVTSDISRSCGEVCSLWEAGTHPTHSAVHPGTPLAVLCGTPAYGAVHPGMSRGTVHPGTSQVYLSTIKMTGSLQLYFHQYNYVTVTL